MELDASLDTLKGIGEKTRQVFDRAGVSTIEELISYYPRTYERYEKPVAIASLKEGDFASICAGFRSRVPCLATALSIFS